MAYILIDTEILSVKLHNEGSCILFLYCF